MAKYMVSCYYEYVGKVAVEANSMEEAFSKGLEMCNDMTTEDLCYVGGTNAAVMDENGDEQFFDIY